MIWLSDIKIPKLMERKGVPDVVLSEEERMLRAFDLSWHGVIVSDDNWLVDGYATYLAAKRLGRQEIQGWDARILEAACGIAHQEPRLFGVGKAGTAFWTEIPIRKAGRIDLGQVVLDRDVSAGGYKFLAACFLDARPPENWAGRPDPEKRCQFIAALPFRKKITARAYLNAMMLGGAFDGSKKP